MAFEPVPFGKYTLNEKLAVGGMAIIYRARIQGVKGFQKDLVIKQILPQYSGMNDFIDMFIDEAKIAVNLNHANIVPVYELGEIDGQLYIAMEYIAGKDLQSMLEAAEEKKILVPPRIAAYVMIGVCRGLDYAHNKKDETTRAPLNIVHRDISPNNVIISSEGEVKIIDFGIAKASIKVSVTQFGTLKGKMIYMSPEQAAEKPLDARSDVFSAGILLYEMVTGKKPYGGDNFAVTQDNVKKAIFQKPSEANPQLPPGIEPIILKAMAREQSERYESAFEFERALSDYLFSTGKNVYARDVAMFLADLFTEGKTPAEAVARPGEGGKVPTITNIKNLSTGNSPVPVVTEPGTPGASNGSLTPTDERPAAELTATATGASPSLAPIPGEAPAPTSSIIVPDEGPAIEDSSWSSGPSWSASILSTTPSNPEAASTPPPAGASAENPAPSPLRPSPTSTASTELDLGDFDIPPPPEGAATQPEAQRDTVITRLPAARAPVKPDPAVTPAPVGATAREGVIPARAARLDTSATSPSPPGGSRPRPGAPPGWGPAVEKTESEDTPLDTAWEEGGAVEAITDEGEGVVPERGLDEETAPGQMARRGTVPPSAPSLAPTPPPVRRPVPVPAPVPPSSARTAKPATPSNPAAPPAMASPPRGTPVPPKELPTPPWAAPEKEKTGGFLSRLANKAKGGSPAPVAAPPPPEIVLVGQYDSPADFIKTAYQIFEHKGLFLTTKQLDTKLGVDIPLEIEFRSPQARFQIHGRVIWRRTKDGTQKGKKLPAGLAIEFVEELADDLEALYAYLGLPP